MDRGEEERLPPHYQTQGLRWYSHRQTQSLKLEMRRGYGERIETRLRLTVKKV